VCKEEAGANPNTQTGLIITRQNTGNADQGSRQIIQQRAQRYSNNMEGKPGGKKHSKDIHKIIR